jgi:nucleoid-associated protein YgaU
MVLSDDPTAPDPAAPHPAAAHGAAPDPAAPEPIADRGRPLLRSALCVVALALAVLVLHRLGSGVLAPPEWSPAAWAGWWSQNDPVTAAMALVRLLALGLGWYLLAITGLTLLTAATGLVPVARLLLGALAVRPLRDVVATLVGVAMVSATSAPVSASPLDVHDVRTPVAVHVATAAASGEPASERHVPDDAVHDVPGAAGMRDEEMHEEAVEDEQVHDEAFDDEEVSAALRRLREGVGRFAEQIESLGEDAGEAPEAVAEEPGVTDATDESPTSERTGMGDRRDPDLRLEHLVDAGESFWSIARDRLEEVGAPTDEASIADYWRVVIDANRDRLVVADHPDLILPGQRLVLPAVGATLMAEVGT